MRRKGAQDFEFCRRPLGRCTFQPVGRYHSTKASASERQPTPLHQARRQAGGKLTNLTSASLIEVCQHMRNQPMPRDQLVRADSHRIASFADNFADHDVDFQGSSTTRNLVSGMILGGGSRGTGVGKERWKQNLRLGQLRPRESCVCHDCGPRQTVYFTTLLSHQLCPVDESVGVSVMSRLME